MLRRLRRVLLVLLALVVLGLGAGFAVFALRGSDAPPPPELPAPRADADAEATATAAPAGAATWEVAQEDGTFVGYRVREEFVSFGVVDAVGRTSEVAGTVQLDGERVRSAELETDMTTLRSD